MESDAFWYTLVQCGAPWSQPGIRQAHGGTCWSQKIEFSFVFNEKRSEFLREFQPTWLANRHRSLGKPPEPVQPPSWLWNKAGRSPAMDMNYIWSLEHLVYTSMLVEANLGGIFVVSPYSSNMSRLDKTNMCNWIRKTQGSAVGARAGRCPAFCK